jgi:hypothetical protein
MAGAAAKLATSRAAIVDVRIIEEGEDLVARRTLKLECFDPA